MDTDLLLFVGVIFALLALTGFFSAFSARRRPVTPMVFLAVSLACLLGAQLGHPEGYAVSDVPDAVIRIIARAFN